MNPFGIVPLADLERIAIERAVNVLDGNIKLSAELLGITIPTLRRKLKEYGNPRVFADGYQIRGTRERRERDARHAA